MPVVVAHGLQRVAEIGEGNFHVTVGVEAPYPTENIVFIHLCREIEMAQKDAKAIEGSAVRENLLVECDGTGGELIDVPENVED